MVLLLKDNLCDLARTQVSQKKGADRWGSHADICCIFDIDVCPSLAWNKSREGTLQGMLIIEEDKLDLLQ